LICMALVVCLAEGLVAFCALAFEIIAARLLAPYAGMSTDTWTAIIAAFLLAMALRNRIGGILAAKGDSWRMLHCAALAAAGGGLAVAVMRFLVGPWDAWVLAPTPTTFWRVVLFTMAPCIPAGMLFGIATPLLMMSALSVGGGHGRVIGAIYAAGAAGSVAGVLLAQWLLLDVAGVRAALATIGLVSLLNAAMMVALAMRWREGTALA
jgi:predicted membrane-bound spermidine synthase